MKLLPNAIRCEKEYQAILDTYRMQAHERNPRPMLITGLAEGARDAFYAAVISDLRKLRPDIPVLCILPDEKEILKMQAILSDTSLSAAVFTMRDFVFYNVTSSREYEQQRIGVLCAVLDNSVDVVLTTPDAALQYTIPEDVLEGARFSLSADGTYDVDDFVTGMIRTAGPTITLNGAWAQNIGESESFVDILGDKGGARLFNSKFTYYNGDTLESEEYDLSAESAFLREDRAFLEAVGTGEKTKSYIDNILESMKVLEYIYRSAEASSEIKL